MTSSELPRMVVQYTGHGIQTETHDQYTALSLVRVLLHIYEISYKGIEFFHKLKFSNSNNFES